MQKLTILLAAILMASTQIFAAEIVLDGITYNINTENNTATVASFNQTSGITQVAIPGKVEYNSAEYPVTSIGNQAFYLCRSLKEVTLPTSITTIESGAFFYCEALEKITIPAAVTSIGDVAFAYCTKMKYITFKSNLCQNNIADDALNYVNISNNLSVYLPDTWENKYLPEQSIPWHGCIVNSNRWLTLPLYIDDVIIAIETEAAKITDWLNDEYEAFVQYKIRITEARNKAEIDDYQTNAFKYLAQHENRKAALAEIDATIGDYSNSDYLQSLIETEITAIIAAIDEGTITTNKKAAIYKLTPIVAAFDELSADLLGGMGDECDDCPAVTISNGTTTIKLYNPQSVSFERSGSADDESTSQQVYETTRQRDYETTRLQVIKLL